MSNTFSPEYIRLRQQGAFAGRIDPFAIAKTIQLKPYV